MLRSLAFKWTATLLLTSLIGVVLVGFFATRTTITEYDRLRSEQARARFVEDMSRYYAANGTWSGLEQWMRFDSDDEDAPVPFREPYLFALVDMSERVVFGHGPFENGEAISEAMLAEGTPILVDGTQVGTALLAQPPPELDPRERRYIEGTNQALLLGALGASTMAVVIGLLISRQFLQPLSQLTQAITAMHSGELEQRVEINTHDELGVLAKTFNEMSANLHRANQLRKQMTADIAHDLRTPLTVISGYLEALTDGTLKPTSERFRVMSEEVALLNRLVEDLRTLSLADAGELRLMRTEMRPRELLDRAATAFKASADAAALALNVDVQGELPDLYVDHERMMQVLGNLVTNAIRHTPAGGLIMLGAAKNAGGVMLTVRDTGSGIAPADLPKIFDRFYRADSSRHSENGESGLGLAIVRSIVEAHGGTIGVTSELGKGSTMTILLPVEPPKAG